MDETDIGKTFAETHVPTRFPLSQNALVCKRERLRLLYGPRRAYGDAMALTPEFAPAPPLATDGDWKLVAHGPRAVIEAALVAHEDAPDWDDEIVLTGFEIADDRPQDWVLEAYLPRAPLAADVAAVAALFADPLTAPPVVPERLPDEDWITLSQQGLTPITAGRFVVHTPEFMPTPEDRANAAAAGFDRTFAIPATRAFGTGHHATTAGCLAMLSTMRAEGNLFRNIADIGTGTGLLAFAALHLWPRALASASDIDHACAPVVLDNAAGNGIAIGAGRGELTMVIADGMNDALLAARGPYDLLIANILAGPLVELAPDFGAAVVPGGSLLLAGLLETQEAGVRAACMRAGFRLARRAVHGDWSVLWLRKRPMRTSPRRLQPRWARG